MPSAQGWKQFLTSRKEMLDAFDSARTKAEGHEVETYHGPVAEAEFRKWLADFLPKRYGVTPGYIVSQNIEWGARKLPHFDVIIYDALNSPVLWVEEHRDTSKAGRSLAIPAEHVQGVIEVKACLSPKSAKEAVQHLGDLGPVMEGLDDAGERYKRYLPPNFFCASVFFELRQEHEYHATTLANLLPGVHLRGFEGGLILRGERLAGHYSGMLCVVGSQTPIQSTIDPAQGSLFRPLAMTESISIRDDLHYSMTVQWREAAFSQFAFDLIARMQGTYQPGRLSSFHAFGATGWDAEEARPPQRKAKGGTPARKRRGK